MTTNVGEETAFARFRRFLLEKEGEKNELETAIQTANTEDLGKIAYNKAHQYSQQGLIDPKTLDAIQQTAPVINPEPFEQPIPTIPPEKGRSADNSSDKKRHRSEKALSKTPGIHTLIINQQKEELLKKFDELAANPDNKDRLLDELLDRFEAKALFDDYHTKFISSIQQLPSFQNLTHQQQADLLERLTKQQEELRKRDPLEKEAGEIRAIKEAKRGALKSKIEELLETQDRKRAQETFSSLVSTRQTVQGELVKEIFQPSQPIWKSQDFSFVFEQLYNPPPRFVIVATVAQSPTHSLQESYEDVERPLSTPSDSVPRQVRQQGKQPLFPQTREFVKNLGKNLGKKLRNKAAAEVGKGLVEKGFLRWAFTAPPYLGEIVLGLMALFALVMFVIIFSSKKLNSPSNNQDVANITLVATTIQLCEKTPLGFWLPPAPVCALTILGLNILSPGDLLNFARAIIAAYPDFQCGQFIWAAERYILHWPVFPGNVNSVFEWYLIDRATHSLPGYTWISNPDLASHRPDPANIAAGDIILYGSTGHTDPGHIAIVIDLPKDKNGNVDHFNITVSEANYHHGAIDIRPTNLFDDLGRGANILGWWRRIATQ